MTQVIDFIGGEYRNRTGLHGFAIRCITYLPTRRCLPDIPCPKPVQATVRRDQPLPQEIFCGMK